MDQTGLKTLRATASENTKILVKLQGEIVEAEKRIEDLEKQNTKLADLIRNLEQQLDAIING